MNLRQPSFSNEWKKKSYTYLPRHVRLLQKITFRPRELLLLDEWRTMALMIYTCKIFITGDPWSSKFIEMRFGDHAGCNPEG